MDFIHSSIKAKNIMDSGFPHPLKMISEDVGCFYSGNAGAIVLSIPLQKLRVNMQWIKLIHSILVISQDN